MLVLWSMVKRLLPLGKFEGDILQSCLLNVLHLIQIDRMGLVLDKYKKYTERRDERFGRNIFKKIFFYKPLWHLSRE